MTSLLGAKKRAEEFAAAADNGLAAAGQRPELAELVDVVSALRSVETPAPRAEFSAALRERLMAEAAETLATNAVLTLPTRRSRAPSSCSWAARPAWPPPRRTRCPVTRSTRSSVDSSAPRPT